MPRSVNGTGTMWYGNAAPGPDGSYVVTEWITVLWVPIIPLGSRRIIWDRQRDAEEKAKPWWKRETTWAAGSLGYYRTLKVPLYVPHLLKAYAITIPVILFLIWTG